jgi:two-component system response regulator
MHPINTPILLIENNPTDSNNIRCTLDNMGMKSPFVHSNNSEEALTYLKDQSKSKPWLILYGLDSKSADGLNCLKIIKTDTSLKKIPVVIIAESHEDHRIAQCFELGAAGYIVKPQDSSKITNAIGTIMKYWNLSELPPSGM